MLNNTQTYSDMWQNCLDRIKAQTSEEEFVKWFQPIVPLEFDGTNLRLRVPNESYVHQIEKNYIPFLRPIISQLYGQQTRLHYAVPRSTPPGRTRYRRCRHHGHLAFQHADQHRKYKESLRNSGTQEDNHRPAAESGAHVRDLHRGRMQPPGTFGGHVRRRKPGQQPLQPPIYMGIRDWARRTSYRPSATRYASAIPSCRCCMSR